jgi:hypothetical protein
MARGITTVDADAGRARRHWARPIHRAEQSLGWPHSDLGYRVPQVQVFPGIDVQDLATLQVGRTKFHIGADAAAAFGLPAVPAAAAAPAEDYSSFLWMGAPGQYLTKQFGGYRVLEEVQELSAFAGQAADVQTLERVRARKRLNEAVDFFRVSGFFSPTGERLHISEVTRALAQRFLKLLPDTIALPQLAPDQDGGLMLYWSGPSEIVITIEDYRLHCVKNAGTQQAEYLDDVPFEGDAIPAAVFAALQ